jgi:hypothetical protein
VFIFRCLYDGDETSAKLRAWLNGLCGVLRLTSLAAADGPRQDDPKKIVRQAVAARDKKAVRGEPFLMLFASSSI